MLKAFFATLSNLSLQGGVAGDLLLFSQDAIIQRGPWWRRIISYAAAALSICQDPGKINPKSNLEESNQAPRLYLPATICNGFNSGNSLVVEQADQPGGERGEMVLIQTLRCDFLWEISNPVSQRDAQEVADPLTDGDSNSICSTSAGGAEFPPSNLPSCSLATEEMFCLLIISPNGQSIDIEGEHRVAFQKLFAVYVIYQRVWWKEAKIWFC